MPVFLITFLSLYGGMHTYALVRLRDQFLLSNQQSVLLAGWMILMTIDPVMVRIAEQSELERTARLLAWPGYTWMGFIFILTSFLLAFDVVRFLLWGARFILPIPVYSFPAMASGTLVLTLSILASLYSLHEAGTIRTDRTEVITAKLPPGVNRVRIVQISDVHLGLLMTEKRLRAIIQAVQNAEPDLVVSTGDLVDGRLGRDDQSSRLNTLTDLLAAVKPPLGKYAITGNHEFYAGLNHALTLTNRAGFIMLRDKAATLPNGVTLIGADDYGLPAPSNLPEIEVMKHVPAGSYKILLKHRPIVPPASDGLFDLQLSGHVHKGQLFPFNLLVKLQFPIPCGTSTTPKGSLIHVSRGSGTWGPAMRLLAPPEVTVIDLGSAPSGASEKPQ